MFRRLSLTLTRFREVTPGERLYETFFLRSLISRIDSDFLRPFSDQLDRPET